VRAAPFHFTVMPLMKPLPLTVSVKAASPAVATEGLRVEIDGAELIVSVDEFEVTDPPSETTERVAVPIDEMSAAEIEAVS